MDCHHIVEPLKGMSRRTRRFDIRAAWRMKWNLSPATAFVPGALQKELQATQQRRNAQDLMDKRKIGGHRVATTFKTSVANPDPFNPFADKFYGNLVFNARGGCFEFANEGVKKAEERIFKEGLVATLATLELDIPGENPCVIKKIKIKLCRPATEGESGLAFKFLQTSEQQLDILNGLLDKLPAVDNKAA